MSAVRALSEALEFLSELLTDMIGAPGKTRELELKKFGTDQFKSFGDLTQHQRYSSSMPALTIRPLRVDEQDLLARATLGNMNWVGERFTLDDVVERPEFSHYTRLVPDRGDYGFVAERNQLSIGVVWLLFLPSTQPGYGFIDEYTPKLSIWVDESERGRGIGRELLQSALRSATERDISQVSLSVEVGNRARQLYASESFIDVEGREEDGVMLWTAQSPQ